MPDESDVAAVPTAMTILEIGDLKREAVRRGYSMGTQCAPPFGWNVQDFDLMAHPERLFAAFGRESLAALGTVAAARRRPSARYARLVELPTPWFVGTSGALKSFFINN
jgi:hypothetical protein